LLQNAGARVDHRPHARLQVHLAEPCADPGLHLGDGVRARDLEIKRGYEHAGLHAELADEPISLLDWLGRIAVRPGEVVAR